LALVLLATSLTVAQAHPLLPPRSIIPEDKDAAAEYLRQLGDAYAAWGANYAAYLHYRQSLLSNGNTRARVRMARMMFYLNDPDGGFQQVQKAHEAAPDDAEATRVLAGMLLNAGQVQQAEQALRPLLAADPADSAAHRLLGVSLLPQGKLSDAEDELLTAVKLNARDPDADFFLAQVYAASKRPARERALLTRCLELDPDRVGALEMLAGLAADELRWQERLDLDLHLAGLAPDNPAYLLDAAQMEQHLHRIEDAAQDYRLAYAKTGPPDAIAQAGFWLANHAITKQDYRAAVDYARRVLQLKPSVDQARQVLVQAFKGLSDWGAAADVLADLVARHGDQPSAWQELLDLQLRAGRHAAAVRTARAMARRWPANFQLVGSLAQVLVGLRQPDAAIDLLHHAVALHPVNPGCYLLLYTLEVDRDGGPTPATRPLLNLLVERWPELDEVQLQSGVALFGDRDYAGAIRALAPLVSRHHINGPGLEALAWSCELTRDWPRASDCYAMLAAGEPQNDARLLDLARVRAAANDYRAAVGYYRRYLDKHPRHTPALLGLARAVGNGGDFASAVTLFELVLRGDPTNTVALRGLALALRLVHQDEDARKVYEQWAKVAPKDPWLVSLRAGALDELASWRQAADLYQAGLAAAPQSSLLHRRLAELQLASMVVDLPTVMAHFEQAAADDSADLASRFELADLNEQAGAYDRSARWWRELLDGSNGSAWAYRRWLGALASGSSGPALSVEAGAQWLADRPRSDLDSGVLVDVAAEHGQTEALLARLDGLLPLRANNPSVRDAYGLALQAAGRGAEAAAWFQTQHERQPAQLLWLRRLGAARERLGQGEPALAAYRQVERLAPADLQTLTDLARVEAATGRQNAALGRLAPLAKAGPGNFDALQQTLRVAQSQGRLTAAIDLLLRLVDGDAKTRPEPACAANPEVVTALALALELAGRDDEARLRYEQALTMAPDLTPARLGLNRLRPRAPLLAPLGQSEAGWRGLDVARPR
jgi:Flp pilus assembly protein TadD